MKIKTLIISFIKMNFKNAKNKFDFLKNDKNFKLIIKNITPLYDTPEWGYPKGRRVYLENILLHQRI